MSFCLILLAAGESKRFSYKIPKPFIKIGGKTILELSLRKFNKIEEIKNILGFETKFTIKDAVQDLKNSFEKKILQNTFENEMFFNIKRMNNINLK